MSNILNKIYDEKLIHPPKWLIDNTLYLTIMGSEAYGTADVGLLKSDKDIYGFCVPPKSIVFPFHHKLYGYDQPEEFDQWQEHHIQWNKKEYDFSVYNLVKYVKLCADGNPNMVDSLFTPRECVIVTTPIAEKIRESRKLFLTKALYHKFRGYAYAQIHKAKSAERTGKRKDIYDKFGFDVKFASHAHRLCLEIEQILIEGDLDLRKHSDEIKAVKRGEVTYEQVMEIFHAKEKYLEELYQTSKIPYGPDREAIRTLLLECLEIHYGNLSAFIQEQDVHERKLEEIRKIVNS